MAKRSTPSDRSRRGAARAPGVALLLGGLAADPLALQDAILAGLPYRAIERFGAAFELSQASLSELIQVPARTLHRRREEGRLTPEESDRLARAARVFGLAEQLFGGERDAAVRWLNAPNAALGGRAPVALARTDPGAREVEDLIGRIEHGVPS